MASIAAFDVWKKSSGATVGTPIQVVQTVKTDTFTTTSSTFTDVTGLSVSITPTSTTNKILVFVNVQFSSSSDDILLRLLRNSDAIGVGTSGSSANGFTQQNGNVPIRYGMSSASYTYLDSPFTTSSTTYKIQIVAQNSTSTACINRRGYDTSYGGSSSITVMEIQA